KKKTVITHETCVDRAKKAEQDAVATLEAFYMANTISKFEEIERERQEIALKERLTLEALLALNQKR
ncbi:615_t:CDS:2, partial [Ambispora leptoticha]